MNKTQLLYCLIFIFIGSFACAQEANEEARKHFSEAITATINGETDKSIAAYEKAIAADPNYSDAIYNLGAIYYNKAIELKGSVKTDDPTYANMKKEANENYTKAAGYFEKVVIIHPNDALTLTTLKEIYKTTEDFEKAAVVKKKLDALPPPSAVSEPDTEKK